MLFICTIACIAAFDLVGRATEMSRTAKMSSDPFTSNFIRTISKKLAASPFQVPYYDALTRRALRIIKIPTMKMYKYQ